MNGYIHDPRGPRSGAAGDDYGFRGGRGSAEIIPHIDDLKAIVRHRLEELSSVPIGRLVDEAQTAFKSARFMMESRRGVAKSYIEYLLAYRLVVETIPCNPDYVNRISSGRSALYHQYQELANVCFATVILVQTVRR